MDQINVINKLGKKKRIFTLQSLNKIQNAQLEPKLKTSQLLLFKNNEMGDLLYKIMEGRDEILTFKRKFQMKKKCGN